MRPQTKLACMLGAAIAAVIGIESSAADKPVRMSGGGGFPVTAAVTSMWGAVDELVPPGKHPLTFMIYFCGNDGWHQRKWKSNQEWKARPFFIEFSSDLTTLRAEVDPITRTLRVFGQALDLSKSNVVMVEHVDRPGEEIVTTLGRVDLLLPEDSNPAVWVLEHNEAIRSSVMGTGK